MPHDKQLSYFIIYGFSGGKLHGGDLRHKLEAAGYDEAKSVETADIVITHSAGYWLSAEARQAKILVIIAPALPQTDPSLVYRKANIGMWREARDNKYLLKRVLWSIYSAGYLTVQPRRNRKLVRLVKAGDRSLRPPKSSQVVIIINREDPWPRSKLMEQFVTEEPWAFISLPGSHEYLKKDPAAYVAIINQYAKRLLAPANA